MNGDIGLSLGKRCGLKFNMGPNSDISMDGEVTASSVSLVSTQEASDSLILTHPTLREIDCAIDTNTKADTVEALVDAIDADIEYLQAARHIIFKHAYNRYESSQSWWKILQA